MATDQLEQHRIEVRELQANLEADPESAGPGSGGGWKDRFSRLVKIVRFMLDNWDVDRQTRP